MPIHLKNLVVSVENRDGNDSETTPNLYWGTTFPYDLTGEGYSHRNHTRDSYCGFLSCRSPSFLWIDSCGSNFKSISQLPTFHRTDSSEVLSATQARAVVLWAKSITYTDIFNGPPKFPAGFHVGYQGNFSIFILRAERTLCLCFIKEFGRGREQEKEDMEKKVICRYG